MYQQLHGNNITGEHVTVSKSTWSSLQQAAPVYIVALQKLFYPVNLKWSKIRIVYLLNFFLSSLNCNKVQEQMQLTFIRDYNLCFYYLKWQELTVYMVCSNMSFPPTLISQGLHLCCTWVYCLYFRYTPCRQANSIAFIRYLYQCNIGAADCQQCWCYCNSTHLVTVGAV